MARKWIYLNEQDVAPSEAEAKKPDTSGRDTTPEAQANTTRELDKSQKTHMQNARYHAGKMKDELLAAKDEYIQKKASQVAEKRAAALQARNQEDASLLDEENDDASIIDNKSSDETKKDLKKDDIKNEKQPLQEFMSFYKEISKN